MEYGQIAIDDGEVLNSTIVHMDFNDIYQDYFYDQDCTLIIKGRSNRIGPYEVKIIEL
jgi:hypothetical protein